MGVETETEDSETANVIVRFIENVAIFVSCVVLISWTILGLNHENGIKSTEIVALIFLSVLLLGSIFFSDHHKYFDLSHKNIKFCHHQTMDKITDVFGFCYFDNWNHLCCFNSSF